MLGQQQVDGWHKTGKGNLAFLHGFTEFDEIKSRQNVDWNTPIQGCVQDGSQTKDVEQREHANHAVYIGINKGIIQGSVLTGIGGNIGMAADNVRCVLEGERERERRGFVYTLTLS